MPKWVGWIVYFSWGLVCFFLFFHLLFPYEALGRRILYTLEKKAAIVTRASEPETRLLGIRWAQVEVSLPWHKAFPPFEIQDWAIELRPLSILVGRPSAISDGTVMGGSFHLNLVIGRKSHHGLAQWDGVQIDRFPLPSMEQAFFGGFASGKALWQKVGQEINGDVSFEMRDVRIKNAKLAGLRLPLLDLGQIKGQMTWEGERVDLKEISIVGEDLKAKLTGNVFFQNPLAKSRVRCRLEIELAENFVARYPAMKVLSEDLQGRARPFFMTIQGTLEDSRFSLSR